VRCSNCGKQLPEDPFFCAYCGALVQSPPPPPAPLPPAMLNGRALWLGLLGTLAALPIGAGFWLLAGRLASINTERRLAIGGLVALLSGGLGASLEGQLRWPVDARPARAAPRHLALAYGLGGGLSVAVGSVLIGPVVLQLGWGQAMPNIPGVLAGATSGLIAVAFALPPSILLGVVAGYALGALAERWPAPAAAAWAAALVWWIAGSAGGGVVGAFVAGQANFNPSTGAYLGAVLQALVEVALLPCAVRLVRAALILTG
jgi:hypothetical protein